MTIPRELRALSAVLSLALVLAPAAAASPIGYDVAGTPGPVVGLDGLQGGTFDGPGTFALGTIRVQAPGDGLARTFQNTPFTLQFDAPALHRVDSLPLPGGAPDPLPVQYDATFGVIGHFSGTVAADGASDLSFAIDQVVPRAVATHALDRIYRSVLPFSVNDLTIHLPAHLATAAGGGSIAITATLVPEPAPAAVLLLGLAALGLRRAGRRRRPLPAAAREPIMG